jgi:hypothetical protein
LNWIRGHFIHPTWLPIQPTSFRLIERITKAGISATDLIKQTCTAVRKQQYCAWPTSDKSCWAVISSMGLSFRRLSFPPSITAVSDRDVPAPCLSALSLSRLAGDPRFPPTTSQRSGIHATKRRRRKTPDPNHRQICINNPPTWRQDQAGQELPPGTGKLPDELVAVHAMD